MQSRFCCFSRCFSRCCLFVAPPLPSPPILPIALLPPPGFIQSAMFAQLSQFQQSMNPRNNAQLHGASVMPLKDSTSDATDNFAQMRQRYVATAAAMSAAPVAAKKWGSGCADRSASSVIARRSVQSVGQGSVSTAQSPPLQFTSGYNANEQQQALHRARRIGHVVHPK